MRAKKMKKLKVDNNVLIQVKDKIKDEYIFFDYYEEQSFIKDIKYVEEIIRFIYDKHYKLLVLMQSSGVHIDLRDFIFVDSSHKIKDYIYEHLDLQSHFLNDIITEDKIKKYMKKIRKNKKMV